MPRVCLQDWSRSGWLLYQEPIRILCTRSLADVPATLREVETLVSSESLFAAGFVSYEAGPAFDATLCAQTPPTLPLLWFGLFREPRFVRELDEVFGPVSGAAPVQWNSTVSEASYIDGARRIRQHLARGDSYQVNFTFRLRSHFDRSAQELFRTLVSNQRPRYAAFVETDEFAICSASPELFFELDGRRITTRPMKGTAARRPIDDDDRMAAVFLKESRKNRAENVMIVDMIRNDLTKIAAPGTVQVESLFDVERYPTVWQMTSSISAQTDAPLSGIFEALFPCASITGAPKRRTTEIIAAVEATPRGVYTGAIGRIHPGRTALFNVAIRTVTVDKIARRAEYGTGSGIVWDSNAGEEYAECLTKAEILTRREAPFELLETLLWQSGEGYFLLEEHLERLARTAEYFQFPFQPEQARAVLLSAALDLDPARNHRVRLTIDSRGGASVSAGPMPPAPSEPVRLRLAPQPVDPRDIFLFHKTTKRDTYEQAAACCGAGEEAVLWNTRGEVTETPIANIVVELAGRLVTPPVRSGLLAGTLRRTLLEQGTVTEAVVTLDDLQRAPAIHLVNSVRGWREARFAEKGSRAGNRSSPDVQK